MLLKSFEIDEFEEKVRAESFKIRQRLANIKDAFEYSIKKTEYLDEETKIMFFEECKELIKTLDNLCEYLRTGKI